jgi:integral membrane sensor domain MASE1
MLLAKIATLSAVYVGVAKLGLMLDAVSGFATLVWAPTGISLAALLLFGYRFSPGVFLGALVVNRRQHAGGRGRRLRASTYDRVRA